MHKANPIASESPDLVEFPPTAALLNGEAVHPTSGGLVVLGEEVYSLSRPDLVVGGYEAARAGDTLKRRVGFVTRANSKRSLVTTLGGEAEYAVVDSETGDYSSRLGLDNELYATMGEVSTPVIDDAEGLFDAYAQMAIGLVDHAVQRGVLLAPVSVLGQREPTPDEVNTNPYVLHTIASIDARTGFSTAEIFRVCGVQPHTRISNLCAALQAAEAMQLLTPILMTPSLSGPFLEGGRAARLAYDSFTPQQQEHINRMGITHEDLARTYQSYRYLLRRIGSCGAGIWTEPAPDSVEAYLQEGHSKLAAGEINTIDRLRGPHTDRIRAVLDGSPESTTFEGCSYDTFGGNLLAISDNHAFYSAIFTALENKAIHGENVVELTARQLGLGHLTRSERLHAAHRAALQASRYGNDSIVYGKKPGQWVADSLLELADNAPFIHINIDKRLRLLGNFATMDETVLALRNWCAERHTAIPSLEAYYDLGLNNAAVYMMAQRQALWGTKSQDRVQQIELHTAKAFHAQVGRLALI